MKKIICMLGGTLLLFFSACTKNDCNCTYYNENGEQIDNYTGDFEDMDVASCSDLSTIEESQIGDKEHTGYICK